MPGVLIIESMAQTAALLLLQEMQDREKKLLYFVAIDNARFRRPVVPGDQLRIEVRCRAWRGTVWPNSRRSVREWRAGRGGYADVQDGGSARPAKLRPRNRSRKLDE